MDCIIAGATGLIGQKLLTELLADSYVENVIAVVRRPLLMKHFKLKSVQTSFEQIEALPPAEVAFCCLGTTIKKAGSKEAFYRVDHDYVLNFAKACRLAGVRVFVLVTAHGADAGSKIFYSRVKGEVERDVESLGFEHLVIVRPSLLLGERRESRPIEKAAQFFAQFFKPLMVGPLAMVKPVEAARVARRMKTAGLGLSVREVEIIHNHEI